MKQLRNTAPRIVFVLALLSATVAAVGAWLPWLAVVGGAVGAVAATLQYTSQGPYIESFVEADWHLHSDGDFAITVDSHGKGRHPQATVYMPLAGGGWEEVGCGVHTDPDGSVTVFASKRLVVQVRIS